MSGEFRLICVAAFLFLFVIAGVAADSSTPSVPSGPPKAKVEPVEETIHGHKIVDPYRYMEDTTDPDTQALRRAGTGIHPPSPRSSPRPRQDQCPPFPVASHRHHRAPQIGGSTTSILAARATRISPSSTCARASTALIVCWWTLTKCPPTAPSPSIGGSVPTTANMSLTERRPADRKKAPCIWSRVRPETCCPIPSSALALPASPGRSDSSGFYYTRHPKKGDVPAGEEVYHVKVFYHSIGSDPAKDPLIFGEGRKPQDIPAV